MPPEIQNQQTGPTNPLDGAHQGRKKHGLKLIILGLVLLLVATVLWTWANQIPASPEEYPPQTLEKTDEFADWKTYRNDQFRFTFQYPSNQNLSINDNSNHPDWFQAYTQESDSSKPTLEIYIENIHSIEFPGVKYCYEGICETPTKEKEIFNDITWDYLGSTSYGDAGESWTRPVVFRTEKDNLRYFLTFSTLEEARNFLKSFKFTK